MASVTLNLISKHHHRAPGTWPHLCAQNSVLCVQGPRASDVPVRDSSHQLAPPLHPQHHMLQQTSRLRIQILLSQVLSKMGHFLLLLQNSGRVSEPCCPSFTCLSLSQSALLHSRTSWIQRTSGAHIYPVMTTRSVPRHCQCRRGKWRISTLAGNLPQSESSRAPDLTFPPLLMTTSRQFLKTVLSLRYRPGTAGKQTWALSSLSPRWQRAWGVLDDKG